MHPVAGLRHLRSGRQENGHHLVSEFRHGGREDVVPYQLPPRQCYLHWVEKSG